MNSDLNDAYKTRKEKMIELFKELIGTYKKEIQLYETTEKLLKSEIKSNED